MILKVEQKKKTKHRLKTMCEEGNKTGQRDEGGTKKRKPTENNYILTTVALRRVFSSGSLQG